MVALTDLLIFYAAGLIPCLMVLIALLISLKTLLRSDIPLLIGVLISSWAGLIMVVALLISNCIHVKHERKLL